MDDDLWIPMFLSVVAAALLIVLLWLSTIPEPPPVPYGNSQGGRLHKPPGRPLSGFAEAHGLTR